MNASEPTRNTRVPRALLLIACVPMVLAHGFLSLLMVFPLFSLLAGNLIQGLFLVWWLLGTVGLGVLVYCSATFNRIGRSLSLWQVLGLVAGIVASVPLMLGYFGVWWALPCAILAVCVSGYILLSSHRQVANIHAKGTRCESKR
jgi:hypothetical protein